MNSTYFRKKDFEKTILWLIIFAAAILRFYNLGEMSMTNDELSALSRLKYNSLSEMILKGVYIDYHPAGLQIFLFYWVKIFGDSEFIFRLPFVVCSLISIWLIYKIGKKWYNEFAALMAAASFSFLTLTILYSQLARMYSPGILFSLLTVYFWTDLIESVEIKIRSFPWLAWVISMSVAMHLHYFSFIFVGLVGVSGLFFVDKRNRLNYISGGLIAAILFLPEIRILSAQLETGDIGGWLGAPSKKFLLEFFFELFNRSTLICLVTAFIFIIGFLTGNFMGSKNRWRWLSVSWFMISFLVAYLYSVLRHPVLMYSTLLFGVPFILLTIFSFVSEDVLKKRNLVLIVSVFSCVLIFNTVVTGKFYSVKHFGVFKEVAEDAQRWSEKFGAENVPLVINVINPDYLNYYFKRMKEPPNVVADRIENPEDYSKLFGILDKNKSPYFSYVWTNSSHPPEVPEIIRQYYPFLIERKDYFNAAAYLFGKQATDSVVNDKLFSSRCDFDNEFWNIDSANVSPDQFYSGRHSGRMELEYGLSYRKKISEIPGKGFRYISFSAKVFYPSSIDNVQIVISFDRKSQPYDYHGTVLSDFQLKPAQWQPVILVVPVPVETQEGDTFTAYFWNPTQRLFYVDDLKVEVRDGVDPYERANR